MPTQPGTAPPADDDATACQDADAHRDRTAADTGSPLLAVGIRVYRSVGFDVEEYQDG
jgi:hypothetical protein